MEVGGLAAADGVNEVGEVAGVAGELLNLGSCLVHDGGAGVTRDQHGAGLALHDNAHSDPAVMVHLVGTRGGGQAPDLEDEGGGGVIVEDDDGIGGGAVVHVAEAAADGEDAG